MSKNNRLIEVAMMNSNSKRANDMTSKEALKRHIQKQRILSAVGKKAVPRKKGTPNQIIKVMSPQEALKRARQKQRIIDMCK